MKRYYYFTIFMLLIVLSTVALASTGSVESLTTHQTAPSWLDSKESAGVAYFLFESPARIERYDMNAETWLAEIPLADTPTAFAVDGDGLYISFGRRTSRFDLAGTGETLLHNADTDVTALFTFNGFLYIHFSKTFVSVDKLSGTLIDSRDYYGSLKGLDVSPTMGKVFGLNTSGSPDIIEMILNNDGTLGDQADSPYGGGHVIQQTFVLPDESHVTSNLGLIYNTNDLTYGNSLAGRFDDLAFYGDLPIALRYHTLLAHTNTFLETGQYTLDKRPFRIYVEGTFIFSFSDGEQGREVTKISVDLLQPRGSSPPIDPNGLSYLPDSILVSENEIVHLLSRDHLSIFRWSVSQRSYLETISLNEAPNFMAYSAPLNRLYLAYSSGRITQIALDQAELLEESFVNSPQEPCGLSTAGEYLFVCAPLPNHPWDFTYSPTGVLLSHDTWSWGHKSDEYIWNEVNRKMYSLNNSSIKTLRWEDIGENGVIGAMLGSHHHSTTYPVRVAPDGSIVVLGSGQIYDAMSLEQIDTLPNSIVDAVWKEGTLLTAHPLENGTQLQRLGTNYTVEATQRLFGTPVRMLAVDEGLLAITNAFGGPWFSIWDSELNEVYRLPLSHSYLPVALHNYCAGPFVDDFSNPSSGWPISDNGSAVYRYLNGEYNIYQRDADRWSAVTGGYGQNLTSLSVEGRMLNPDGVWGVLFGLNENWSSFYTFEIVPEAQAWFIFQYTNATGWRVLANGTSGHINSGQAVNRLSMSRNYSNRLRFEVNDQHLTTRTLGQVSGRIGLTGGSFAKNVDIRYDNFVFVDQQCPTETALKQQEIMTIERPAIEELLMEATSE